MSWQIRGRRGYGIPPSSQKKAEMTSSGISPSLKPLQDDSMDKELRAKLFNAVLDWYINPLETEEPHIYQRELSLYVNPHILYQRANVLMDGLVSDFIKKPKSAFWHDGCWWYDEVQKELIPTFENGPWEDVYFLLTMFVKNYPDPEVNNAFMTACNKVLEEENSAYQFTAGRILPKMSDLERMGVEEAASGSDEPSRLIDNAVELLSHGDTRNAIKEAVSAVESLTNLLSPKPDSTDLKKSLPRVLERIEKALGEKYNPSLKEAFTKMYDYASSEPGIRHGSKARPTYAEEAEARFAVVTCSALINYLRTKADEAGIKYSTN